LLKEWIINKKVSSNTSYYASYNDSWWADRRNTHNLN